MVLKSNLAGDVGGESALQVEAGDSTNQTQIINDSEPRLYRVIWRWHFYAGLIVLPILVIVSLTGALYVFREELEQKFNSRILLVEPQIRRVAYAEQIANAKSIAPVGARPGALLLHRDPKRATQIIFNTDEGRQFNVFVNQYSGTVQGSYFYGDSFFDVALKIHCQLFAGQIGRLIVELATSWGIILAVTGLYLWWPRGRMKIQGVWLPRLQGKGYLIWRDWHAVPGLYFSLFAVLIMFTGLFFTSLFGRGYQLMIHLTKSNPDANITQPKPVASEDAIPISIDEVISIALRAQQSQELYIDLPQSASASFFVYAGSSDNPTTITQLYLDQYSGQILRDIRWHQLSIMNKTELLAYPIHAGSIWGLPTKILALATCLLIVCMSITGTAMWWTRRPGGKTGFPQKTKGFKPSIRLLALICLLGLLMPAAGISIALIVFGEWLLKTWRQSNFARS